MDKSRSHGSTIVGSLGGSLLIPELLSIWGMAILGSGIAPEPGGFGRATASDVGWFLGLFSGLLLVYCLESATIGLGWPQNRQRTAMRDQLFMVATVTWTAVGSVAGLLLLGKAGGWIGMLVGFVAYLALQAIWRKAGDMRSAR